MTGRTRAVGPSGPAQNERRKGARTRAAIPAGTLRALNEGREETITLVEWLAVDQVVLLEHVLDDVGVRDPVRARVLAEARAATQDGVNRKMARIASALHENLKGARRDGILRRLAGHRSDIAREWAALVCQADETLAPAERLAIIRPFAADPHMGVREMAWVAFRPCLGRDLRGSLRLLAAWARDEDPNIRRFASEVSRPRGVWTTHLTALKADPEPGLVVLEPLRSDGSRYVQASVGNWLNDASKSRPDWVESVCARWLTENPTPETAWIVRRARRTIARAPA